MPVTSKMVDKFVNGRLMTGEWVNVVKLLKQLEKQFGLEVDYLVPVTTANEQVTWDSVYKSLNELRNRLDDERKRKIVADVMDYITVNEVSTTELSALYATVKGIIESNVYPYIGGSIRCPSCGGRFPRPIDLMPLPPGMRGRGRKAGLGPRAQFRKYRRLNCPYCASPVDFSLDDYDDVLKRSIKRDFEGLPEPVAEELRHNIEVWERCEGSFKCSAVPIAEAEGYGEVDLWYRPYSTDVDFREYGYLYRLFKEDPIYRAYILNYPTVSRLNLQSRAVLQRIVPEIRKREGLMKSLYKAQTPEERARAIQSVLTRILIDKERGNDVQGLDKLLYMLVGECLEGNTVPLEFVRRVLTLEK